MPKSKSKNLNIGPYRAISFACGKEIVQGPVARMKLVRKLHDKTCDICSKCNNISLGTGIVDETNGQSGVNAANLQKKISEYEKLERQ